MKLVMFNEYIPGLLIGTKIFNLTPVVGRSIMDVPGIYRMTAIIEKFPELRADIAKEGEGLGGVSLASVRLRAPIPKPSKMLFGVGNFNEGMKGHNFPIDLFLKSPSSMLDPGGEVVLPPHEAQLFFHEAELGFVIGKRGQDIPQSSAMDFIFGYLAVIDVSSGGLPGMIGGIRSKSFDTFCPMGPCIVTADEIPDPHKLGIKLWIGDELRQDYNTDDMEHPIPEIIEFASQIMTLEVGDIFACGTNHMGIGPIQDGEKMTIEIERIGRFTVSIADARKRKWPVGPDRQLEAGVKQLKSTGVPPASFYSVRRIR